LVVAGALSGIARGGWFWDDLRLIVTNPVVQNLDWLDAFFKHLWWGPAGDHPDGNLYWRPLVLCSFLVDRWAGGSAALAHLHSLLWHLLAVVGVQRLAERKATPAQAAVAAVIFGLHPAACETVFWVAARNDLMGTAGLFWALWAFSTDRPRTGGAFVLLSALSKETALLAPLLAAVFLETPQKKAGILASLGAVALVLALRGVLGIPLGGASGWDGILPASLHLFSQITVPWPLVGVQWVPALHLGAWDLLGGGLSLGLCLLLRRRTDCLGAALLLGLPGLVAVGATGLSGERFLYGSLGFLCVGMAPLLSRRMAGLGAIGGLVVLAVLGLRIAEWSSEEDLLRAARERSPSALISARLGLVLEGEGQSEEALQMYAESLTEDPPFLRTCDRPPALLRKMGRTAEALAWEQRFSGICPTASTSAPPGN
jgi:hypothetical protein